jgi:hypothetical protein
MEPISLATVAALQAVGKVQQGIPAAIGATLEARAMRLTPEEERELAQLKIAEEAGRTALTAEQQAMIRQQFLAEQGAAARTAQATQLQAAAARGTAPATAGRELFLAEQAGQVAAMERTQARNLAEQAAEQQAAAERAARIAQLEGQEEAHRLARAQAITTAVAVPFGAAGETAESIGSAAMAGQLDPALFTVPPEEDDLVSGYVSGLGV